MAWEQRGRPAWPSQAAARRGDRWRAKPRRQSTRECWVCSPETRIAVTSLSCACESVPGLPDQRRTNRLVPGNKSDSLAVLEAHSAKSRCPSSGLPAGSSSLGVRGLAAASLQSVSGITRPSRVCVAQGSLRSVRVRLRDSVLFITTPLTSGEGPLRQRRVTLACSSHVRKDSFLFSNEVAFPRDQELGLQPAFWRDAIQPTPVTVGKSFHA